jgi:hypothetical protein
MTTIRFIEFIINVLLNLQGSVFAIFGGFSGGQLTGVASSLIPHLIYSTEPQGSSLAVRLNYYCYYYLISTYCDTMRAI